MLYGVEYMFYVAFMICIILNIFLLYIVKCYTSRKMQAFGNLITQTIIVDILSSAAMTLIQFTVESKNGIAFYGSGNSWLPFGQWNCFPIIIFAITNNVIFWGVPIQALYRYIMIVRKQKVPSWLPMLIYSIICFVIFISTFPIAYFSQIGSTLQNIQPLGFWQDKDTQEMCVIEVLSWPVLTYLIGMVTVCSFGISLLLWCNKQLNKALDDVQMHFTAKTRQIHKEITRKLYAQAAVPMVMSVLSVSISVCLFFKLNAGLTVALLLLPYPWIVVINPMLTLCCIRQYRSVATAILQWKRVEVKKSSVSVVTDGK